MPGKIVKTKSGHTGRTDNDEPPVTMEVLDNANEFQACIRRVTRIRVTLDDGKKLLCDPSTLQYIGNWD